MLYVVTLIMLIIVDVLHAGRIKNGRFQHSIGGVLFNFSKFVYKMDSNLI